jgi:hypothetical protein
MARLNNRLITKQMPWHANMTELNHLGAALLAKPTVLEGKMNQLFTSTRYSDNPLSTLLAGKSEKTITTTQWEWDMKGASVRPLVIVEAVEPDGNTTPGKYKQPFRMKLDEDWYVPGDIIHPGTSNKKYQVRIQSQPFKHGNGYIYEVRGMWDDNAMYMPTTYLQPGQQWAKLFSQYEEAAEQSGSTQYSLPISLTNRMGRYRKKYRVTGDAAQEVLAVAIPDNKGKMHNTWIKYAEVEYWEQWYRELERGYWYSRSTDSVLGANGRPIYSGPGVQELLEDSHVHFYSHLSARLIEEYLMDIFYSRVKPGKGRKIKAFTGEYGMIQFHRAIQDWQEKKKGFIQVVDQVFISKTSSEYNENALVAGYQYVRYRMANGAELELIHNPLYDDREINFAIDPITGYPEESQRITFLDFSGGGDTMGNGNIVLMNKENSLKLAYVCGLQTPYGPSNKGMQAHSGDYYEMHVQKQCGVHIEDITKCGELILSRAA